MLSTYLSINLIDIVGEYVDSKTYQTLIEIDPIYFNEKKLKNNLVRNLPISYISRFNFTHSEAVKFLNSKFPGRKLNLEEVIVKILYQNLIERKIDYDYDKIYYWIKNKIDSGVDNLQKIYDIYFTILAREEDNINFTFLESKERQKILCKVWHKFIYSTAGVYETSNPGFYIQEFISLLREELKNEKINTFS